MMAFTSKFASIYMVAAISDKSVTPVYHFNNTQALCKCHLLVW